MSTLAPILENEESYIQEMEISPIHPTSNVTKCNKNITDFEFRPMKKEWNEQVQQFHVIYI